MSQPPSHDERLDTIILLHVTEDHDAWWYLFTQVLGENETELS